jgi:hypothetical protein
MTDAMPKSPGAVAWFRWSLLGFSLLLPLAISFALPEQAARNAAPWVKELHHFVQVHVRQPVLAGGVGILVAWLVYGQLTAWSLRQRPQRAVLDAHGLCFLFPFLVAITTSAWYALRHVIAPRPSDGPAAFWELMEGVFVLCLGATAVTILGFWIWQSLANRNRKPIG